MSGLAAHVHLVFVYGTLRRGEMYHSLLQGARFMGLARTKPIYELVHLGEYPGMIARGATSVMGEIYEVSDEILRQLDELEECPRLYTREQIALHGSGKVWGYVYRGDDVAIKPCIPSGDWCAQS